MHEGFKCMLDIQTVIWRFFEEWAVVLFIGPTTANTAVTASETRKCRLSN